MDTYNFIYQYIIEEESLKVKLISGLLSPEEAELTKSRISLLQAAKEMTYSLMK
jgi:hypothetical protein